MSYPNLRDKISFKIPFFYGKTWICYTNILKKGGVELAFVRGNELSNAQGVLDFKKRKQVGGITYHSSNEIDYEILAEILNEAIDLDTHVPYRVKKKKTKT